MSFKVLFEFSGLAMLQVTGEKENRRLDVLLTDKGKDGAPHFPRLVVPVENLGNVPKLLKYRDALGLQIIIGPGGQYLCAMELAGKSLGCPGAGGVWSETDPTLVGGQLPMPICPDDWRPLAYLPNIRTLSPAGATVVPKAAVAQLTASAGYLYAASSPNEKERFRKWEVRLASGKRTQYLADRAVLEIDVTGENFALDLGIENEHEDLVLRPPDGDSAATVVVAISSHCCLSASPNNVGNLGPAIEDLAGYEKFVAGGKDLSEAVILYPESAEFTIGNPRCPSAVWE